MHHSIELRHRDRNFGAILLVWDRLFATYAPPEPFSGYGIPGSDPPRTLLGLYVDPWRRARR
jgi:sterol desaturase/sphingolipid hydroxylase (fatty acid hydroxylase superfamily)